MFRCLQFYRTLMWVNHSGPMRAQANTAPAASEFDGVASVDTVSTKQVRARALPEDLPARLQGPTPSSWSTLATSVDCRAILSCQKPTVQRLALNLSIQTVLAVGHR